VYQHGVDDCLLRAVPGANRAQNNEWRATPLLRFPLLIEFPAAAHHQENRARDELEWRNERIASFALNGQLPRPGGVVPVQGTHLILKQVSPYTTWNQISLQEDFFHYLSSVLVVAINILLLIDITEGEDGMIEVPISSN
jgi:hypothetical protein